MTKTTNSIKAKEEFSFEPRLYADLLKVEHLFAPPPTEDEEEEFDEEAAAPPAAQDAPRPSDRGGLCTTQRSFSHSHGEKDEEQGMQGSRDVF